MRGTEVEDERHSTVPDDPRPRLRRRFFASLVLIGLLLGAMIGRLTAPGPVQLERIEEQAWGLTLWFDRQPELYDEHLEGAFALLLQAQGEAQSGQLQVDGTRVGWRLQHTAKGLLLHLVAARPLRGEWAGQVEAGGWRLDVRVTP
ncbi:hypothetical protein [Pseudomonas sp. BAY1663]|uniref:hypothetical protein n=1 Tax=Pseudomonas sp. BAY1663 TaxID=1439940 RepID=UPI0004B46E92|nr:hypothetical protein [Pseudomonas sp. BAY1663]